MLYLVSDYTNPYFNLSLEEYLFSSNKFNDDIIIIWRNEESLFLGKNQNPYVEILHDVIKTKKVPILRRISGGGTVYHDLGNVNMTFIQKNVKLDEIDFISYTKYMQEMLISFGVDAMYSDRKDLLVGGRKISGSAQCIRGNKCIYHGTLLFDANLDNLNKYLNSNKTITSHATKSVRSKVCNLNEYLDITIEEFIANIEKYICDKSKGAQNIVLADEDLQIIEANSKEKYSSDEWIFEKTPKFNVSIEFEDKKIQVDVNRWRVKSFKIINKDVEIDLDKLVGELFFEENIIDKAKEEYKEYVDLLKNIF